MMSLSDLRTLTVKMPPLMLYCHENQLTYPLAPGEAMDMQFGFTDITSALAADVVCFNSKSHKTAFFDALPGFIKMMPEYLPMWVISRIREKSMILYPGCRLPASPIPRRQQESGVPLIIWNHRWEFDKNPSAFFAALYELAGEGIAFEVALLGENFQAVPKPFIEARDRLSDRIVAYGYEPDRSQYQDWLGKGHVIVSTAIQENFGISIVEGIGRGCLPLLPRRLSYPEILPDAYHDRLLYDGHRDLTGKLAALLKAPEAASPWREPLARAMERYAWRNCIGSYDRLLERLAAGDFAS